MIAAVVLAAAIAAPKEFAQEPLRQALQEAVDISPDVAQAREHVNENRALLAAARGLASPALIANYAQAPQGGNNNTTITQRLVTVGGQVTIGDYLSYAPAVRQAAYTLTQAEFDLLAAQRIERLKVADQYFGALRAAATLDLRRQDAAGAQSDLRAAQIRFRAGDAPRLDVVRAQVALANAQAGYDAAEVDLHNAIDALSLETGRPASSFSPLRASPTSGPNLTVEKAVARALATRSDYASAQQAVEAERAAVSLAQHGAFPALSVNAGYTTGVDSGVAVHGPSANVNLSVPISHTARDRAEAERARLASAQFRVEGVRRQIVLDVTNAVRTFDASARASAAAARARAAAQEELRATQIGYRSGASSSLDVADARRTYLQAALNELDAVYAQAQAAAKLEMEVGP